MPDEVKTRKRKSPKYLMLEVKTRGDLIAEQLTSGGTDVNDDQEVWIPLGSPGTMKEAREQKVPAGRWATVCVREIVDVKVESVGVRTRKVVKK